MEYDLELVNDELIEELELAELSNLIGGDDSVLENYGTIIATLTFLGGA